jgi:hypothetical protein
VTGNGHGNPFWYASTDQISHRGASEIMRDFSS